MNITNPSNSPLAWICATLVCLSSPASNLLAQVSSSRGTDILHYSVLERMVNGTGLAAPAGRVQALHKAQGQTERQDLDIYVWYLDKTASYQLAYATDLKDDGTFDWKPLVETFTPNRLGRATFLYRKVSHGTLAHGRLPLADALAPVSVVKAIGVFKLNMVEGVPVPNELVLSADLTDPDRLGYLVKRNLSTDSVRAYLRIQGNRQQAQFRLVAYDLTPNMDYHLFLNGVDVKMGTTGPLGGLVIQFPLVEPLEVLGLWSVELKDTADPPNVIVSTSLP
jgi:hypothetical protein